MPAALKRILDNKTFRLFFCHFVFFTLSVLTLAILRYNLVSFAVSFVLLILCQFLLLRMKKIRLQSLVSAGKENPFVSFLILLAAARVSLSLLHCYPGAGLTETLNYSKMCSFLCLLMLYGISVFYHLLAESNWSFEKMFALQAVLFGIVLTMIFPVYGIADEPAHLRTAYSLSNTFLGIEKAETKTDIYMREDDASFTMSYPQYTAEQFNAYLEELASPLKSDQLILVHDIEKTRTLEYQQRPRVLDTEMYQYVFPAFGISLGRLLKLNTPTVYLLARFFNLIAYTVAAYICIKYVPIGKALLSSICLLPMSLQLAGSPSRDVFRIICAMITISMALYLFYGEGQKDKHVKAIVFTMIAAAVLLFPLRTFIYSTISVLPLLIFAYRKKWITVKRIIIMLSLFCLLAFGYVFVKTFIITEDIVAVPEAGLIYTEKLRYTGQYFINHPVTLIKLFQNTFWIDGYWYVSTMIGSSLGWLDQGYSGVLVIILGVLLILNTGSRSYESVELPAVTRVGMVFLCILSCAAIMLGMALRWTELGSLTVQGVQGRYFLPLAFPFLLAFKSIKVRLTKIDTLLLSAQFTTLIYIVSFLLLRMI